MTPDERGIGLRPPSFFAGRLLFGLALALIGGLLGGRYQLLCGAWLLYAAAAIVAAPLLLRLAGLRWAVATLLAAALCGGAALYAAEQARLDALAYEDGDTLLLQGRVIGAVAEREQGKYQLRLRPHTLNGAPYAGGDIMVYGSGELAGAPREIEVTGELFTPYSYANANAFDYNEYLRQQGYSGCVSTYYGGGVTVLSEHGVWSPPRLAQYLRDSFNTALAVVPELERDLLRGVFLGDKVGLDYQMKSDLGLSGLLHAFAVSGLHVGYIVLLALLLVSSGYRRRWVRLLLSMGMLLVYMGLTGLSASILRAALLALTLLLAEVCGEDYEPLSALALAALLCLLWRPLWLFSSGFQLSFAAAFGISYGYAYFERRLRRLPEWLRGSLAVSLAAALYTLPLVGYYFYHISWAGLLLSPLFLLLIGVVVMGSFMALAVSLFWPWLAETLLLAAGALMRLIYEAAAFAASLPLTAVVTGAIPVALVLLFYAGLLSLQSLERRRGRRQSVALLLVLVLTLAITPPLLSAPARAANGVLDGERICETVFLDVGQGDAALMILPDQTTLLLDGGGSGSDPRAVGEHVLLPYLKSRGITGIDYMIASHPDSDHIGGLLTVVEHLPVGELIYADVYQDEPLWTELLTAAELRGVRLHDVAAGDVLHIGELRIEMLWPRRDSLWSDDDGNYGSLVCGAAYGEVSTLFCGDAPADILLLLKPQPAQLLKLAHHGSDGSYCESFYQAAAAEAVIVSCKAGNSYGHPGQKVIEYWQERAQIWRTDQDGAISVYTDGKDWYAVSEL
ncbi:MAG: DNA internalization-related competence protein ComEC/Rec2 [Bacillota bacterium]|nr:DNA internalization-related competence protein ComEC/Rec2 [Bacillota bacterium]